MSKNSTPKELDPTRIANLLTRSAERLDDNTVTALRRARNVALERQAATQPALTLNTGHRVHWPQPHISSQWTATILLAAAIAGGLSYWHHAREHEVHLEVSILTDDMPLEVFVDR
jgi:hypothetical protein